MEAFLRLLRRLFDPSRPAPVPVYRRTGRLLFVGLFLVMAAATEVRAQYQGEGGISVIVGLPQGSFASTVDGPGIGLSFFGGASGRRSPILAGIDLGFLVYGYERRREPFSYTIPDVGVDVVTSNNIFLGHFLLRVRPPRGPVRPYVDALFGLKYLFTSTEIKNDWYYDDPIATTTNFDDAAASYGVGGGIDLQLTRGRGRGRPSLMLHAGVRYLFGGQAEYLLEGSIRRSGGRVTYDVYRSNTTLIVNEFGLLMRF